MNNSGAMHKNSLLWFIIINESMNQPNHQQILFQLLTSPQAQLGELLRWI